jgi:preprotein translocase subunit YajC
MLFSNANAAETNTIPSATVPSTSAPTAGEVVGEPSPLMTVAPLILIFIVFYFLLIRPQQKRLREHDALIKALKRGDKIVTGGGVIGTIHKIDDDVIVVEVAPEVRIRVMRDTVSHLVSKTPVANDNKSDEQGK